mmetsp:Transcript_38191/g.82331  ORF Transcript_38191/g.82331 Transcript_38191/m.82331 type:complete len:234 (+) Transcript_38191:862-1563(+)
MLSSSAVSPRGITTGGASMLGTDTFCVRRLVGVGRAWEAGTEDHFLSNATRRPPSCAERSCAQAASTSGARAPPRKVCESLARPAFPRRASRDSKASSKTAAREVSLRCASVWTPFFTVLAISSRPLASFNLAPRSSEISLRQRSISAEASKGFRCASLSLAQADESALEAAPKFSGASFRPTSARTSFRFSLEKHMKACLARPPLPRTLFCAPLVFLVDFLVFALDFFAMAG